MFDLESPFCLFGQGIRFAGQLLMLFETLVNYSRYLSGVAISSLQRREGSFFRISANNEYPEVILF